MPRGGWPLCIVFPVLRETWVRDYKLKKKTNAVIISIAGRPCSQKRFLEKLTKGIKTQDLYFGQNTLHESKAPQHDNVDCQVSKKHHLQMVSYSALNVKNFIKVVEHVMGLINYYTSVHKLEREEFQIIDHDIRQLLIKYGIHIQPAKGQARMWASLR
ncbi:unnamed protein product [Thelazia callipaeda]|uniref:40S ribosomal protein S24 n=1 Tax=Thelazia callipaeda TaxID=103827 RepID=A0A0N5CTB7_THECL|nr:unnamed protein product [Thelazia callipaeda]